MATAKLRKENQALRSEITALEERLDKITNEVSKKKVSMADSLTGQEVNHATNRSEAADKTKSIEFISAQYDDIIVFKNNVIQDLKDMKKQVSMISKKCEAIMTCVEQMEDYSYQYNLKNVGMPQQGENESAENTTKLCLNLFAAIGAEVTEQDIDISHRVLARRQSNQPSAIICKFVRRLAKERVLALRRETSNVQPQQLGFSSEVQLNYLSIYEHLPPRLQELLFEANKYKRENNFKFCWVRNEAICLRKSEGDVVIKLTKREDLAQLLSQEQSL